jgi:hypothetical protein
MKQSDEQFDRMLSDHFGSRLDPMLGRSQTRFQLSRTPTATRVFWNRTVLTIGGLGISAVAGAIAMAITLSPNKPVQSIPEVVDVPVATVTPPAPPASDFNDDFAPFHVASQLIRHTVDEGTVYFEDGTPMRRIREREIQQSVFIDPRTGRLLEVRVPSETVRLLGMQKY